MNIPQGTCADQKHTWTVYGDLSVRCSVCGKPSYRMDTSDWYQIQAWAKAHSAYRKAGETNSRDPNQAGEYPAVRPGKNPPVLSWAGQGRTEKDALNDSYLLTGALVCGLVFLSAATYLSLKAIFG